MRNMPTLGFQQGRNQFTDFPCQLVQRFGLDHQATQIGTHTHEDAGIGVEFNKNAHHQRYAKATQKPRRRPSHAVQITSPMAALLRSLSAIVAKNPSSYLNYPQHHSTSHEHGQEAATLGRLTPHPPQVHPHIAAVNPAAGIGVPNPTAHQAPPNEARRFFLARAFRPGVARPTCSRWTVRGPQGRRSVGWYANPHRPPPLRLASQWRIPEPTESKP